MTRLINQKEKMLLTVIILLLDVSGQLGYFYVV